MGGIKGHRRYLLVLYSVGHEYKPWALPDAAGGR
jgi:hypothetical protein